MSGFDPNAPVVSGGIYGLPTSVVHARVVLLPVPVDATTSYGKGTARGPEAILAASRQVDLYDVETGRVYEAGIAMLDVPAGISGRNEEACRAAQKVIDAGGVGDSVELRALADQVNGFGEEVNAWVGSRAAEILNRGAIPGVIGGDHSVPFGAIAEVAARYPGVGVLHLDAHADLRHAYEGFASSHASIMYNVERIPTVGRLVQVGIRDVCDEEVARIGASEGRIVTFFDADLWAAIEKGESWRSVVDRIVAALPDDVYVSFDIDGLDPSLCPNTGTPVPGGLSFAQSSSLLGGIARSGRRIVGFDLCEVSPGPSGDWDANVGARVLYKLIGWTAVSAGLISLPPRH